jgi:DNA end-binding protein Ku
VKAYKATDIDGIERNMYHSTDCVNRLKYQDMVCSGCGATVPDARKNALYGVTVDGKIVFVTDDEMKAQQPSKDGAISITEFVPAESVEPIYYESTEYLACGEATPQLQEAYANFREGLMLSGRIAIGRVVSRGHEYTVAIRPHGNAMLMSYLFAEYEIRNCDKFSATAANPTYAQVFAGLMSESDFAKDKFTPADYDSCLKNQRAMIAKKAAGQTVECPKPQEQSATAEDVLSALKAMLEVSKKAKAAAAGK